MAEETYDEEVLLENSPLSQYLRETCPDQEFETIPAVGDKRLLMQMSGDAPHSGLFQLRVVKEVVLRCLEWLFPPVSKFIEDVNAQFLPQYSSQALHSQLLLDTDRQTIEAYRPNGSLDTRHPPSSHQYHLVWVCGRFLCAFAVLVASLSVILPFLTLGQSAGINCSSAVYVGLALIALLSSLACLLHWTRVRWILNGLRRLHKESIQSTEQCLRLLDRQWVLAKRSIRYIQEVEVISRGFTMVGQYTPIVRLENATSSKQHRQCHALRQACFCAARAQFNSLRDATLRLMKQLPLVSDVDHISNYLAVINLDDVAAWLKVDDGEDASQDSLSELTGCFSLAALKAMNSLFLEQRSEFIRRLILSVCPDARLQPYITADTLKLWLRIVQDVSSSCESSLVKLQRSYDCHRQRPGHSDTDVPTPRLPLGGDESHPQCRASSAVRSLRLHLEATLNRVISVEESLEASDADRTPAGEGDAVKDLLTSGMLETVRRELTASQDCLQEAVSSLEKMNSKEQGLREQKPDSDSADRQGDVNTDSREPILLLPLRNEIEFDDQVFEAYTDTEPWERTDEDWDEGISAQEKIRRQREAEESKRMLQELRSVLAVRQVERKRMISERNRASLKAETGLDSRHPSRDAAVADDDHHDDGAETDLGLGLGATSESGTSVIGSVLAIKESDSGFSKSDKSGSQDLKADCAMENASGSSSRPTGRNACDIAFSSTSVVNTNDSEDRSMVSPQFDVRENISSTSDEPEASSNYFETGEARSEETEDFREAERSHSVTATSPLVSSSSADEQPDSAPGVGIQCFQFGEQKKFGMSFLPSLAAEVAMRSRHCQQEEETFFGSDDDSE